MVHGYHLVEDKIKKQYLQFSSGTAGGVGDILLLSSFVFAWTKKKKHPSAKSKMADVEMDIASRRMNNGNEHV